MKKVRETRGMTMKETAQKIGVSASTYRDWEYGRKIPVSHATKIAEVLSISLSDLVGEISPKNRGQLLEAISLIEEALKKLKDC
ncbi:MAG: helix-turn-helix transcriptional regulator [Bdellovibrionaceae bacterium]|nr:helix-turn-helix transcriptional regulator [Pseudobdellovibrionaceae bacterium]